MSGVATRLSPKPEEDLQESRRSVDSLFWAGKVTLPSVVESFVDAQTVLAAIGLIASVVTIIGGIYKGWQIGVKGLWERLRFRIARSFWRVPKKTLIVLPHHQERLWWHMGGVGGEPSMQIVGDFFFTNISDESALVPKTFIVVYYRRWGFIPVWKRVEGHVFVRHPERDVHGLFEIPPRFSTIGRADWWITPPIADKGLKLRGRAGFTDKFGNEHWTGVLTWKYS